MAMDRLLPRDLYESVNSGVTLCRFDDDRETALLIKRAGI